MIMAWNSGSQLFSHARVQHKSARALSKVDKFFFVGRVMRRGKKMRDGEIWYSPHRRRVIWVAISDR